MLSDGVFGTHTWAADSLGAMGLFEDGVYVCPEDWVGGLSFGAQNMGEAEQDTTGVCCVGEDCQVTTPMDCHDLGGDFYLGYIACDPNPCPALAEWLVCEVDSAGTGDYQTIQDAIDAGCDEIVLADGTYRGDGNRDINFWGRDISVYSASDDPSACVIDCAGAHDDLHRGFVFRTYEGPQASVRGISITNGFTEYEIPGWT